MARAVILFLSMLLIAAGAHAANDQLVFSKTAHNKERWLVINNDRYYSDYITRKIISPSDIAIALYDLNDDGKPEIISYTDSSITCNKHGCDLQIYETTSGQTSRLLGDVVVAQIVKISPLKKNGFKSLILSGTRGGNIWSFNSKEYRLGK